jgi:phage terminase small subunit
MPAPDAAPATLTAADCPDVLTDEGRALWGILVSQRPTDKMLGGFVAMYVEATLAWQRATVEVQKRPDFGMIGKKPVANPHLKLRREAEATMFRVAQLLGWQAPVQYGGLVPMEAPKSRLELFLQARGGA